MSIESGTIIAGHYRVLDPLGQGGMGEVFSAENTRTGRKVAVKLLRAEAKSKQSAIERFRREARAAGSINSDFVTEVLDVEDDPAHGIVLVFELLEGESLIERLKRTGPIPYTELWGIVEAVWIGLADAHAAGIVHRDLKPSNVYLEQRRSGPWVKILDFGISKLPKQASIETLTQVGQSLGTFSFMPPEQIGKAKSVDHRADIYACTTLVYQAMSGKLPYKARNVVHMMDLKRKQEPRTLGEVMRTPIEPGLEAFIAKGLARKPDDRYQSAAEALAAWRTLQPPGAPSFVGTESKQAVSLPPPSSELATIQMNKPPVAPAELRRLMEEAKARRAAGQTHVMREGPLAPRGRNRGSGQHPAATSASGGYQAGQERSQSGVHPAAGAHPSHGGYGAAQARSISGSFPASGGQPQAGQAQAGQVPPARPSSQGIHSPPTTADEARALAGGTQSLAESPLAQQYQLANPLSGPSAAATPQPGNPPAQPTAPAAIQHHPSQNGPPPILQNAEEEEEGVSTLALVVGGLLLVAVGFAAVALALRYL